MSNNQNKNQPINNGLTPTYSETSNVSVSSLNIFETQTKPDSSSVKIQIETNDSFTGVSNNKSEVPIKQVVFPNSTSSLLNNSGSSDTLKDAVRKWHAKRKKDPNENEDFQKLKKLTKTSNVILNDKIKQPEIKLPDIKNNCENFAQTTHNSQEQKRSKSNSELETYIKDPFDGPLSFDTIMALKKKKSEVDFDETCRKNINCAALESIGNEIPRSRQICDAESLQFGINDQIDTIRKKIIGIIGNFQNCTTQNEVIKVFVDVINSLLVNIEEIIQKPMLDNEKKFNNVKNSLELCISIVSQRSSNLTEELDEIALNFLAKYPIVFESLKTLTNVEPLNVSIPDTIYKHILKYINSIEKINQILKTAN
ncbi:hypothetical protein FG386_002570 [Cryptosporidium ryanae]|uniref:uncharacterized protein n=1 Tax=Cryptosporidium ryanae TaxID=515981 RepID=UPI003519FCB1|nr:hypothetical protein FG386_002570 [Cryptosporidium ryanae]